MIQVQDLSFGYKRGSKLFNNINLNIEPGKIYGLLGKNGMGKTTLLKLMCGLLHQQGGSALLNGRSSKDRLPTALQDFYIL